MTSGCLYRVALAVGLIAGAARLSAETYPARPVKIIVSTSPGGITDIAARILGADITDRTGQPVVIDDRPGASGDIAMEAVARAAPDGYTLGFASTGNITINPNLFVRNGALRVLTAATREREPYVPDTPTFAEQGFPGFEVSTWFALFAPRCTPDAVVEALNSYTRSVRNDPDAKWRLESNYIDPLDLTAAGFAALVKADAVKWERIVRDTGAQAN
jgi:tripartite-type tricarboxylate transporter receptor subunit TctC